MKKIIDYFIKHHVAVNVVIIAFIIFGIVGAGLLKSSFFPLTDSKIITVQITYPGASPLEIEEGVILKIEENLKSIQGVDRITSVSKENAGTVTVEIEKGKNIDFLLLEVKNAIDRIPSFPIGMEPPIVGKRETIRQTISFAINGENIPLKNLKAYSEEIENDLRGIEGISQINISGFPDSEIEIAINENTLLAYNISFSEVSDAVKRTNILTTGGTIKTSAEEYLIRGNNRNYYGDELGNIVVRAQENGALVYLKDIAKITDRFSETPRASFFNGKQSVNVTVTSTNNEDLMSAAESVRQYMKTYNASHLNIHLDKIKDVSTTLTQRTALLTENAVIGILLVLLFLSVFLDPRLAFWVAFGLPISFLGMFIFAHLLDITINVLSLFGMIIVIGILVDDGIVIAENIYHEYEKGKHPVRAAIDGTIEVIPPIISAILTTILAFSTFLFLDGRIGDFFSEVSKVVILTLVISLFEALIILPAHLAHSKALKRKEETTTNTKKNGYQSIIAAFTNVNKYGERIMVWIREKLYAPILRFAIQQQFFTFCLFTASLILTIACIRGGIIGATFFPRIASDTVSVELAMPNGTSKQTTDSIISAIEKKAWDVNQWATETYLQVEPFKGRQAIDNIIKNINSSSNATLKINLLPGEDRPNEMSSAIISSKLRKAVGGIPGAERLVFGSGGNFGGSPVSVSLLSNNIDDLKGAKKELKSILENDARLKDVADNDPAGIKEIKVKLKPTAYTLGLTYSSVLQQVRSAFFGVEAQRFQRGLDEIRVWVRYGREERSSIKNLSDMRIVTPKGTRIPLKEISSFIIERGDLTINHLDGRREIQISADLENPDQSATDILSEIRNEIMPKLKEQYPSISASYEGQNREASKVAGSAGFIFPVVFFLIYLVIAFTFRSYSQPLLLLSLIPFSLVAVAWGHWIHGFPINILSALGIIALIGIMVNDGLVFIEKFNSLLRDGLTFESAMYQTGIQRFRAIFLTSITTIAGLAPLIFEKSRQAQFLKPMAISIAYGIGLATILTLIMLPILLSFGNNVKVIAKWLITGKKVSRTSVERAIKEQQEDHGYE